MPPLPYKGKGKGIIQRRQIDVERPTSPADYSGSRASSSESGGSSDGASDINNGASDIDDGLSSSLDLLIGFRTKQGKKGKKGKQGKQGKQGKKGKKGNEEASQLISNVLLQALSDDESVLSNTLTKWIL